MIKDLKIISKDKIEVIFNDYSIEVVGKGSPKADISNYDFLINGIPVVLQDNEKLEIFKYIRDNIDMDEYKLIGALEVYDKMKDIEIQYFLESIPKDILIKNIKEIIDIFIIYEEYEKCAKLNRVIGEISNYKK